MKKNSHLRIEGKKNTFTKPIHDHHDCTVRAYAEAFDIPYIESHAKFREFGRRYGRGVSTLGFMTRNHPDIIPYPRPHMTVGKFIWLFGKDRTWMIVIKGHVFTVKNRVIFDDNENAESNKLKNINCHVLIAWMIK